MPSSQHVAAGQPGLKPSLPNQEPQNQRPTISLRYAWCDGLNQSMSASRHGSFNRSFLEKSDDTGHMSTGDGIIIRQSPETYNQLSKRESYSTLASSIRSIPITPSDSENEEEDKSYDVHQGERHRVRELEDIQNWAKAEPSKAPSQKSTHSHLPNWCTLGQAFTSIDEPKVDYTHAGVEKGDLEQTTTELRYGLPPTPSTAHSHSDEILTAYPRPAAIRHDLEDRLTGLLNFESFEHLLAKPSTRAIFREWLTENQNMIIHGEKPLSLGLSKLDQWTDESYLYQLSMDLKDTSRNVLKLYYDETQQNVTSMRSAKLNEESKHEACKFKALADAMGGSRRWLMQSLFAEEFKHFITCKLVDVTKLKLCHYLDDKSFSGLGDSFVLTNPRFKDNPIVIVSPGFAATTGYDSSSIIGRNCRFLQGPGTSPQSIERLRVALRAGEPCVELLLNYRSDGSPFYCLLSILPLFDQNGSLTYFIGGQINVTSELENNELIKLMSKSDLPEDIPTAITEVEITPSPVLSRVYHPRGGLADTKALYKTRSTDVLSKQSDSVDTNATKRSKFDWLTSKMKREKDSIDLGFKEPEARLGPDTGSLEKSITAFQSGYSRIILFKKMSRAVVFVTPEALNFLGLPTATHSDTYASPLIHTDFFDLLEIGQANRKTKGLKSGLKKVLSNVTAASFACNVRWSHPSKDESGFLSRGKKVYVSKPCIVHLTPLIDGNGKCTSYVAILS